MQVSLIDNDHARERAQPINPSCNRGAQVVGKEVQLRTQTSFAGRELFSRCQIRCRKAHSVRGAS